MSVPTNGGTENAGLENAWQKVVDLIPTYSVNIVYFSFMHIIVTIVSSVTSKIVVVSCMKMYFCQLAREICYGIDG